MALAQRFDLQQVRSDFPGLHVEVHGQPLAYLDNASTTQKPKAVLEAVRALYETQCANIHRGVHSLSAAATQSFEAVRTQVAAFLGASEAAEVVFTSGTTEAINLVASSYGRRALSAGDRVLVSEMEHHSNLVPWQLLCAEVGAHIDKLPLMLDGTLDLSQLDRLLTDRTRIIALSHASNALGTVNPVAEICARARAANVVSVVDGAQAAAHLPVDVQALGCDFYALSAHKIYGPTGVGVLWGQADLLRDMPPYKGGGEMINSVSFEESTWAEPPQRFEAGTPNIAGVVGLGAALKYLEQIDSADVLQHEMHLLARATEGLSALPGVQVIGAPPQKVPVLSFIVQGAHPHDVGTLLDLEGVAVRTGHHCAEPVMQRYGVPATVRASFGLYNTLQDVQRLISAVQSAQGVLT